MSACRCAAHALYCTGTVQESSFNFIQLFITLHFKKEKTVTAASNIMAVHCSMVFLRLLLGVMHMFSSANHAAGLSAQIVIVQRLVILLLRDLPALEFLSRQFMGESVFVLCMC